MFNFVFWLEGYVFVAHCLTLVIVVVNVNHSVTCALVFDNYVLIVVVHVVLRVVSYFVYGRRRRGCCDTLTFGFVRGYCGMLLLFVRGVINVVEVNVLFGFVKL